MKIVIDIPEEQYITLNAKSQEEVLTVIDISLLIKAIKNGTPLPKGHGRLVDMSEVIVKLMQYYDRDKTIGQCLDEVHTVIEADGGDTE